MFEEIATASATKAKLQAKIKEYEAVYARIPTTLARFQKELAAVDAQLTALKSKVDGSLAKK